MQFGVLYFALEINIDLSGDYHNASMDGGTDMES
jgi:hypothetical protein